MIQQRLTKAKISAKTDRLSSLSLFRHFNLTNINNKIGMNGSFNSEYHDNRTAWALFMC